MARTLAALLTGLALAGCGREDEPELPAACRLGPDAVRQALRSAPQAVRLDGATRVSDCLIRTGEAGDVLLVGEIYLDVAAGLANDAQANPVSPAALQLGYLVGAVRRGAGETQGIHDELVRRLEQESARIDTRSAAYRRGERAGLQSG